MPRMAAKPIPRTKFLIIKAPMSTVYEEKFGGDRFQFQVNMFVQRMTSKNISIGLALDCTSLDLAIFEEDMVDAAKTESTKSTTAGSVSKIVHQKYMHNSNDWEEWDVDYARITAPNDGAIQAIPSEAAVQEFIKLASQHWVSRPKTHIAIFDSRGGAGAAAFLAASYMIAQMRAPVHVAIASIKDVVPPGGIYDERLLEALQMRYRGKREIVVPEPPTWYKKVKNKDAPTSPTSKTVIPPFSKLNERKQQKSAGTSAMDMPPPPPKRIKTSHHENGNGSNGASSISSSIIQELSPDSPKYDRALTVLKQMTMGYTDTDNWPFAKATAMDSAKLQNGLNNRFLVTWKAKGRRGLLLLLNDGAFFVEHAENESTSSLKISIIPGMWIPSPVDLSRPQHRTLVDGIIVTDQEEVEKGKPKFLTLRYLIFDIIAHEGGILVKKPLSSRLKYINDGVVGARKKAAAAGRLPKHANEAIRIRMKDHFELGKVPYLLSSYLSKITHGVDGLVFTPKDLPYYSMEVLQWRRGGGTEETSERDLIDQVKLLG